MRILALLFVCCLFFGCDPYYKLQYCVKNQTTDTVYVKYMNFPDSLVVILPDSSKILKTFRGIGYAKDRYKTNEFKEWFKENSILVKKTKEKEIKKISDCEWKYEGKRIIGNGVLYVKK